MEVRLNAQYSITVVHGYHTNEKSFNFNNNRNNNSNFNNFKYMKNLLTLVVLFLSISAFCQNIIFKELPKDNIQILIVKTLDGHIEFDGHIFDNKKSEDPIKFEATLKGIEIYDSKNKYQYRECSVDNCKIIHLELKQYSGVLNRIMFTSNGITTAQNLINK